MGHKRRPTTRNVASPGQRKVVAALAVFSFGANIGNTERDVAAKQRNYSGVQPNRARRMDASASECGTKALQHSLPDEALRIVARGFGIRCPIALANGRDAR